MSEVGVVPRGTLGPSPVDKPRPRAWVDRATGSAEMSALHDGGMDSIHTKSAGASDDPPST